MFDFNVLWIKCPIDKTIDPGFKIKGLVYRMVSVMHHTKSDIKGFDCIFVIV